MNPPFGFPASSGMRQAVAENACAALIDIGVVIRKSVRSDISNRWNKPSD